LPMPGQHTDAFRQNMKLSKRNLAMLQKMKQKARGKYREPEAEPKGKPNVTENFNSNRTDTKRNLNPTITTDDGWTIQEIN
jgi:hypothetical protein